MAIPLLPPYPVGFPHPTQALAEPDGLLAAGGALTTQWLIEAYARGIFPWFEGDDEHIYWWSPSTRAVLAPGTMRVTKSLAKRIKNSGFSLTLDQAFSEVMSSCMAPRTRSEGTWITPEMQRAYRDLHDQGFAHSFEVWLQDELVGGLYGVSLGTLFFGESMFSRVSDASKVAFFGLQNLMHLWHFPLIDCQLMSPHLASLGVTPLPRQQFLAYLETNPLDQTRVGNWQSLVGSANLLAYAG